MLAFLCRGHHGPWIPCDRCHLTCWPGLHYRTAIERSPMVAGKSHSTSSRGPWPEPDLCMGAGWWAVHKPGTKERSAMDHGARTQEVRGQTRGHFMDHGEEGGPTSAWAPGGGPCMDPAPTRERPWTSQQPRGQGPTERSFHGPWRGGVRPLTEHRPQS